MRRAILALDCTGETFSCGLQVDGRYFTEVIGLNPRRALKEMPDHIRHLLRNQKMTYADIGGVGVTQGPGSFTGVRLGITLAKTIAYAAGCGLFPIDTLGLIAADHQKAYQHNPGSVAVAWDARKKELYCYLTGDQTSQLLSPSDFAERLAACEDLRCLAGPGFKVYPDLLPADFCGPVLWDREQSAPRMSTLCELTRVALQESRLSPHEKVEPVYLRTADVQVSGAAKS